MQRVVPPAAAALVVFVSSFFTPAEARNFQIVHTFCAKRSCADGKGSAAAPTLDPDGNIYGTTTGGGAANGGTVFEATPVEGGSWKYKVLYGFCAQSGCTDGEAPFSTLVRDLEGHLYGTTLGGGTQELGGTAFELFHTAKHGKWRFRSLHNFCAESGCTDGQEPAGGLAYAGQSSGTAYDGISPLYGALQTGGLYGKGNIYRLTPHVDGRRWDEKILYSFCAGGSGCADGSTPIAAVTVDAQGNIYGTTFQGGQTNSGTVFELKPNARRNKWSETVLHSFGTSTNNADGISPAGTLLLDTSGVLYGTAASGGNGASCPAASSGCGTVFKLVPQGTESEFTVLYSFCELTGCIDGSNPEGNLALDSSGSLVGTTFAGGSNGAGTVYALNGNLSVLYNFCSAGACSDGMNPEAGLAIDGSGNYFGTAIFGGSLGGGTLFELSP